MASLLFGCVRTTASRREPAGTTLPALDSNHTPLTVPSPEPTPPGLSYYEAYRQIKRIVPPGLIPLIIKGHLPILLHDLNTDNQPEGFSVAVARQDLEPTELDRLAEYARLFQEDLQAVEFYLLFFGNKGGQLYTSKTHYLGRWHVYEFLKKGRVFRNRNTPLIVTVSFHTREGTEQELFVFSDASGTPSFRTSLKNTLAIKSKLEDLDGDGVLDLLIKERGMEEGTGYETFLTWYRWNGERFTETQSRNVVRNLRAFLKEVKDLLQSEQIRALIELAVDPDLANRLRRRGLTDRDILIRCLGLDQVDAWPDIREVLFPDILEDPFMNQNGLGSYFRLSFRIVDQNGISQIADTLLYMPQNPFQEKQFYFYPD